MRALILLFLFVSPVLAEQFSAQNFGIIGTKRTLVDAWFFNEGKQTATRGVRGAGDLLSGPVWITGYHGPGLNFLATNSRVELQNESAFDFITQTSTWTLIIVYKADNPPNGIIFSKTNTFSAVGFYMQGTAAAADDMAINFNVSGVKKIYTPPLTKAQSAGKNWRVFIFDYCSRSNKPEVDDVIFSIDGVIFTDTNDGTIAGSIANNNLAVISGWDAGTSTPINWRIDMMALLRGDGQQPLTVPELKTICNRALGR